MSGITDSAKFNSNSSYYLANEPSTAGGTDTINGNLTVTGNTSSLGSLSAGTTLTVSGTATLGGAVNATGLITSLGGMASSAVIVAPVFTNTTASPTPQVIQIVSAGVPVSGVTVGSTGTGNNLLAINMATLIPNCSNYKSYRVFISGSSSNRYSGMTMGYSGGGSGGAFITQWQAVAGFALYTGNYKGNVSTVGLDAPAGSGGTLAVYPDNVIVCPSDLTGNILYYGGTLTNGATGGFNVTGTNVWLTFVPIL